MKSKILHGPPLVHPMEEGTAGKYLFDLLKKYVDIPSCMTNPETGLTISYQELLLTTCRLAKSFTNIGYPLNTVIGICTENSVYHIYPIIASLYTGLIASPIDPNYTEREFLHIFNISRPQIMFCSKNTVSKILEFKKKIHCIEKIIVLDDTKNTKNTESLTSFINTNSDNQLNIHTFTTVDFNRNEQVAVVVRTSGTTGLPKGVMMTHKNLIARFTQCRDPEFGTGQYVKKGRPVLNCMPLYRGSGLTLALGYISFGLHVIQMQKYTNKVFLESIQKYKIEKIVVIPTVLMFLIKSPLVDKYDLSSVTELTCGSSPLSKKVLKQLFKRFKIKNIAQSYALTEALVATKNPLNNNKIGSIGKLLPLVSAKVIDLDTKECLGSNQTGELCLKGDIIMKGYMGDDEATRSTIDEDGWLHTGDVGYYDEDEHFFIVDRIKEMIKYTGRQISPTELELLLMEHPRIKDVAVVGKPQETAGELPAAFIVTQPGETLSVDEVHKFLTGKIIDEKRLRGGIKFMDAIPRNSGGKILRKELVKLL